MKPRKPNSEVKGKSSQGPYFIFNTTINNFHTASGATQSAGKTKPRRPAPNRPKLKSPPTPFINVPLSCEDGCLGSARSSIKSPTPDRALIPKLSAKLDLGRAFTPQLTKEGLIFSSRTSTAGTGAKATSRPKAKRTNTVMLDFKQSVKAGSRKSDAASKADLERYKTVSLEPPQRAAKAYRRTMGRSGIKHAVSTSVDSREVARKKSSTLQCSPSRLGAAAKAMRRQAAAVHQANVKVVARVRPLNKKETGVGEVCCSVVDNTTISFPSESFSATLDYAFGSDTKQAAVYEVVGKATIDDVLNGYNGTILAYGQTSSGKTYTMFGSDIYDEECKGIIPRAAFDIFQKWETQSDVKEVDISCSMLEIYREDLRDLLVDDPTELKIKESPEQGICVEGLSEMAIGCEEELMYWIDVGESRRVWAETQHNAVSSRSHTLLMLEVRQIMGDGSEKRGILNLVDLAGSEKVGRSGAQGKIFQEGTKINLSLSALGNVIHALTSNLEHIPYRDSKLTRLLQESLGGNYKTTLVVTCSPHSSELAEGISTLKFAQRAKKLKNKVQMNIKNSPGQLLKVIEQLREELRMKDAQMQRMAGGQSLSPKDIFTRSKSAEKGVLLGTSSSFSVVNASSAGKHQDETTGADLKISIDNVETNSGEPDSLLCKLRQELKEARTTIEGLRKDKADAEAKIAKLELSLVEEKKRVLAAEQHAAELEQTVASGELKANKKKMGEDCGNLQVQILENQIKALNEALDDAEGECFKLLKEKKEKLQKDAVELYSLNIIDYVNKSTLQTSFTSKWVKDLGEVGLEVQGAFVGPKNEVKLDDKQIMSTSKYAASLDSAVVSGYVSPDTIIYLLKNQLIDASILNHNLKRVVSLLAWKLHVEKSVAAVKGDLGNMLQKTVDSLEVLLTSSSARHQTMRRRLEKLDYEISLLKQQCGFKRSFVYAGSFLAGSKPRLRKPIKKLGALKQSAFARSESRGLRLLKRGVYTPVSFLGAPKELRWEDVCRPQISGGKKPLEDDGRPQVAEMNEEDEKTLILELDATVRSRPTEPPRPSYYNSKRMMELGVTPQAAGEEVEIRGEEMEALEHGLRDAQIDLAWHKEMTDLLMKELAKSREQVTTLKNQVADIKLSSEQVIQDENRNWKMVTDSLKENYEQELERKQKAMSALHELLAQWIVKYMELEKSKVPESSSLIALLTEYREFHMTRVGQWHRARRQWGWQ